MGKLVYLATYRQQKLEEETRREMERVEPQVDWEYHTNGVGLVKLPSLDDYDAEGEWWEGYWEGLLD